jgi:hypothetical protein
MAKQPLAKPAAVSVEPMIKERLLSHTPSPAPLCGR